MGAILLVFAFTFALTWLILVGLAAAVVWRNGRSDGDVV